MRIAQPFSGEAQGTSMARGDESEAGLYRVLVDRFQSLEASHARMREQFDELVQEKKMVKNKEVDMVGSGFRVELLSGVLCGWESLQKRVGTHGSCCSRV
jgi:hypothetical protein